MFFVLIILICGCNRINKNNIMLNKGIEELIHYSKKGNEEKIREELDLGTNVNLRDAKNYSAIMYACNNKHTSSIEILLDSGADPDSANSEGVTLLMSAAHKGFVDLVKLLLRRGANVNCKTKTQHLTPLIYACSAKAENVNIKSTLKILRSF